MEQTSLPQPQQTPQELKWQADYIQEYYYMVWGNRCSMGQFLRDIVEFPDLTVRQLLDYFSLEIADGREQFDEEDD